MFKMSASIRKCLCVSTVALAVACSQLMAADGPDKYTDGKLTVEWTLTNQDYSGTFTLGANQFPATAHVQGNALQGSFTSGTHQFAFTGTLSGDVLALNTGGTTYQLKRIQPENPLAAANPLAAQNGAAQAGTSAGTSANTPANTPANTLADAPAGYTVVSSSASGKAISIEKTGVNSVQSALEATLPDLAQFFGTKPTIGSAYQDAKNANSGGATFSDTLNGQPIKGIISCTVNDKGALLAVVYAKADTSKAEWDKLTSPAAPTASAAATPPPPPPPAFNLHEFDFPDGTGSLELADGWTTAAQTCINPVFITGPAQQSIVVNNMVHIDTPDSPLQQTIRNSQRMQEQMAANARAMGRPAPPPFPKPPGPPPLVSPYLEPVDALKAMMPQFSAVAEYNHGPSTTIDSIISVKDAKPNLPNGKAAIIKYAYTQTLNGQQTKFLRSVLLETAPQGAWGWTWFIRGVAAPEATFDHDAPLMFAMLGSLRVNQAQFTQNLNAQTQNNIHNSQVLGQAENQVLQTQAQMGQDNMNTQNSIYQQQHQAQMDGYAQHNQQWAADETQKQRNTADFIETIKGTRMVYDTQTGATGYANLSDVTGVVDSLNQAALDPNRFVQVPLRDYLYAPTPVPSR
jgi:hypothetical protein